MSGVYIKGMEMPKICLACQLAYDSCSCILTGERFYKHGEDFDPGEKRLANCPLIPVPEHGRLIDADDVALQIDEWMDSVGTVMIGHGMSYYGELLGCIEDAPTIIPEEKEDGE